MSYAELDRHNWCKPNECTCPVLPKWAAALISLLFLNVIGYDLWEVIR